MDRRPGGAFRGVLFLELETFPLAIQPILGSPLVFGPFRALKDVLGEEEVGVAAPQDKQSYLERMLGLTSPFIPVMPGQDALMACLLSISPAQKGPFVLLSGTLPFVSSGALGVCLDRHASEGAFASVLIVKGTEEREGASLRIGGAILNDLGPFPHAETFKELLGVWDALGKRVNYVKLEPPDGFDVRFPGEVLWAFDRARRLRLEALMNLGVLFEDPNSAHIESSVTIEKGVRIGKGVVLQGKTSLGEGVCIGPYCILKDAVLHREVEVLAHSVLEGCEVMEKAKVGPFARVRPETVIGKRASVGNFVELKKTTLGEGVKANHLSYLGDCEVGAFSNIGAGVITCNFDGVRKHRTKIAEHAFIGSDCQLVAPVEIGHHAYIGAGSTITRDVPARALAVRRAKLRSVLDWASPKASEDEREG